MFDPEKLHARVLELLAAAPDAPTVQVKLAPEDFPPGFQAAAWVMRHSVDLSRAMNEALAGRPEVRKVEIVCPQVFRIPFGFEIPQANN